MVSFWPWKGDDSSPASFEKTLSALSTKITNTQGQLDRTRATSRRVRVLWMLYLSFAYLVYAVVLILVVGYPNLSQLDWAGLALGPLLIYLTRLIISSFFNWRIEGISAQLKQQQDERKKTIQKLKDATRYDSTLQLLEKYGDDEGKGAKGKQNADDGGDRQDGRVRPQAPGRAPPGRTTMAPPPTANIPRRDVSLGSAPGTPQPHNRAARPHDGPEVTAEFAPNALAPPGPDQYVHANRDAGTTHWYDRVLDLLLGEDETAPKNRIVLICQNCRLVNGQAPPGTKSLSELGIWKCMGCGTSNGEADEGERIVKEVLEQNTAAADALQPLQPGEEFKDEDQDQDDAEPEPDVATGTAGEEGHGDDLPDTQASGRHAATGARKRKGRKT